MALRSDAEIHKIMGKLNDLWIKHPMSGGTNNATSRAGIKQIFEELNAEEPFRKDSAFVDLGCSVGLPVIYAALKYGIRAYGIEYDPALLELAQEFAKLAEVEELVEFTRVDLRDLTTKWLRKRNITHVFSYDAVFSVEVVDAMWPALEPLELVGLSSDVMRGNLPASFQQLRLTKSIKLAGSGASQFKMVVWRTASPSRSPSPVRRRRPKGLITPSHSSGFDIDHPEVMLHDPGSPPLECSVCNAPAKHVCARCETVFYCSPVCQREQWPSHRFDCTL
jgi:hypothetical protein